MQYDTNHDFNLQNKEVRAIFNEKAQKGVKGVSEEEIDAAVTRVIDKFDVDKDKQADPMLSCSVTLDQLSAPRVSLKHFRTRSGCLGMPRVHVAL